MITVIIILEERRGRRERNYWHLPPRSYSPKKVLSTFSFFLFFSLAHSRQVMTRRLSGFGLSGVLSLSLSLSNTLKKRFHLQGSLSERTNEKEKRVSISFTFIRKLLCKAIQLHIHSSAYVCFPSSTIFPKKKNTKNTARKIQNITSRNNDSCRVQNEPHTRLSVFGTAEPELIDECNVSINYY
jgi:hypothetical protein